MSRTRRRRQKAGTRSKRSPFEHEFRNMHAILNAQTPNNLAVAVVNSAFNNMPNINSNIPKQNLSNATIDALTVDKVTKVPVLLPMERFAIADKAHSIFNAYAGLDVVGILHPNMATAERSQRFSSMMYPMMQSVPVPELFAQVRDNIFAQGLVDIIVRRIAGPTDKGPMFNLENVISNTLLNTAARLRIETLTNIFLTKDMKLNVQEPRYIEMQKIADGITADEQERHRQKIIKNLLAAEEEEGKQPKSKKKPNKSAAAIAAAPAAAIAASPPAAIAEFMKPITKYFNESSYLLFRKVLPTMKTAKYMKTIRTIELYVQKIQKQTLLKVQRAMLEKVGPLIDTIMEAKQRMLNTEVDSRYNKRKQERYLSLIDELRPISNSVSFYWVYLISRRQCPQQFSPLANCKAFADYKIKENSQAAQMQEILQLKYNTFIDVARRQVAAANAKQRSEMETRLKRQNLEKRIYRTPKGNIMRVYVPPEIPKKGTEIEEPQIDLRVKALADDMMERWRQQSGM